MTKRLSFHLNIDGHTDNTGSASLNKALSLKRANAAKTYLEGRGVDGNRITTKGYGKDKPIATNKTAAGRAKNRRVEFLLVE
jgi:OOP family OmpA-OmpF porin